MVIFMQFRKDVMQIKKFLKWNYARKSFFPMPLEKKDRILLAEFFHQNWSNSLAALREYWRLLSERAYVEEWFEKMITTEAQSSLLWQPYSEAIISVLDFSYQYCRNLFNGNFFLQMLQKSTTKVV